MHIGLGEFGFGWFEALAEHDDISLVGIVDFDASKLQKARDYRDCALYSDAATAMDEQKPDFIVNATPPAAHKLINKLACDRNIPILCEKPIAENYDDALDLLDRAKSGQKIMIAENYRYTDENRFVKSVIGGHNFDIIKINFRKCHFMTNYHKDLLHPLLLDVTVHHLDLLRYFTGSEVNDVYADFYTPEWSWYKGYSNAAICLTMENGIKVFYNGSLDAYDDETSWNGSWEFSGENGVLRYNGYALSLSQSGRVSDIPVPQSATSDKNAMLDDFITYLKTGSLPQTHIFDNIKTFEIVHSALQSFESKKVVSL